MELFKNKYRINSARHPSWNYGNSSAYFITICTANRIHYFGEIKNGRMCLNELGSHAHLEWHKSKIIRPDMNLKLGAFVVMPNHVHGIVIIGNNQYNADTKFDGNKFGPQRKNLASILRGFKSAVTTYARKKNINFAWQSRFHDHIIRSQRSYQRIENYIVNNPNNWRVDRFY